MRYARFPAIGNATQLRNASADPQANRNEFYFFRSPQGRQPIRGANSNDVVVIITSWRVRAHGNFDLRCVALPIAGNRALVIAKSGRLELGDNV